MRRWVALAVLLAVLLGVACFFFFIKPARGRISEANKDLIAAQQVENNLRSQILALQAIKESEVEYLASIGQMETLIPEQPLLDEFIEDIYALCGSSGVKLLNLAPAMPVPMTGSTLRQITVAATIDGEFFEVLDFLWGVMDMERLVRVDAIAVSSGQDETGATTLSVSLSLRLFTLADLVPVAAPSDDAGTPSDGTDGGTSPEAQTTIPPSTVPSTTVPSGEG